MSISSGRRRNSSGSKVVRKNDLERYDQNVRNFFADQSALLLERFRRKYMEPIRLSNEEGREEFSELRATVLAQDRRLAGVQVDLQTHIENQEATIRTMRRQIDTLHRRLDWLELPWHERNTIRIRRFFGAT